MVLGEASRSRQAVTTSSLFTGVSVKVWRNGVERLQEWGKMFKRVSKYACVQVCVCASMGVCKLSPGRLCSRESQGMTGGKGKQDMG